ncbi:DUF7344 domain-containing protein [Haladaptatus sp. NG-WS-4]
MATKVAAWEMNVPEGDVLQYEIEKTYVSLYHAHVPKFASCPLSR